MLAMQALSEQWNRQKEEICSLAPTSNPDLNINEISINLALKMHALFQPEISTYFSPK